MARARWERGSLPWERDASPKTRANGVLLDISTARPEEELCLLAEDVFLETDLAEFVRLCDTESPGKPRATEVAVRYVEE